MLQQDLQYFIENRAEHLAIVHLTRRQDLSIQRMDDRDRGLDLLVTIQNKGVSTGKMFGINVKAKDAAIKDITDRSQFPIQKGIHYYQDLPFPACVFFFTMEDDRGYYQWLKYPLLANQTSETEERDRWYPLDDNALEQIVKAIAAWYNAKQYSLA
ncbi:MULTISPECIES: DUF4365 domain-containing protein [Spirulina sp. CCY15215]|uniref:DUF4365 domain-containing protein n=1 Tax=Spirulina sp. CCY15215 TaxID=2767591 RepID=UPI0019515531|nr:DUF4365 domain-containing protein [Spirulina major]